MDKAVSSSCFGSVTFVCRGSLSVVRCHSLSFAGIRYHSLSCNCWRSLHSLSFTFVCCRSLCRSFVAICIVHACIVRCACIRSLGYYVLIIGCFFVWFIFVICDRLELKTGKKIGASLDPYLTWLWWNVLILTWLMTSDNNLRLSKKKSDLFQPTTPNHTQHHTQYYYRYYYCCRLHRDIIEIRDITTGRYPDIPAEGYCTFGILPTYYVRPNLSSPFPAKWR